MELQFRSNNYEYININYTVDYNLKEIRRLLKIVKNPTIKKQLEYDLKSWEAIKRLVDADKEM